MKTNKKQAKLYQITNKQNNLTDFVRGILNRTLGMFEYTGLPDSLPARELEKRLQLNGYATVFKNGSDLLVSTGSLIGQEKSPYNEPTKVIINVPQINFNKTLTINKDCVVIYNDDTMTGLLTTIRKHGTLLVENEITMLLNTYNDRISTIISGGTDQTINNANVFINNIIDGNLGVVAENNFLQDLKVQNNQQGTKITFDDLIEYQQYIKSDLYNELGLSSLNNMKKERMNMDEVNANNDNIYPLVDSMLRNRTEGIQMVNKLFNGEIKVDFSGTWKDKADNRNTPDQSEQSDQSEQPEQPEQSKQSNQPDQSEQPEQKKETKGDK